jgi:hypothetical protein
MVKRKAKMVADGVEEKPDGEEPQIMVDCDEKKSQKGRARMKRKV